MDEPEQIIFEDNKLKIPNNPIIPFIEGDGIGRDIWTVTKQVIDNAVKKAYANEKKISWKEIYAGEKAYEKLGEYLPKETLSYCNKRPVDNTSRKRIQKFECYFKTRTRLIHLLETSKIFSGSTLSNEKSRTS